MRIEGDHAGDGILSRWARSTTWRRDFLMAEMQAVEIADGKHGAARSEAPKRAAHSAVECSSDREVAHARTSKLKPS